MDVFPVCHVPCGIGHCQKAKDFMEGSGSTAVSVAVPMSEHVKWMAQPVKYGLLVRVHFPDRLCLEAGLVAKPAALFIDHFAGFAGGGFHAGGFHAGGYDGARYGGYRGGAWAGDRYWHAPVYHGAWYAGARGAAVGAAYNPYVLSDQCGYYPYSPCE
jgi:hypothetical protein